MSIPEEQLNELKEYFGEIKTYQEGGLNYLYISNLALPVGCNPTKVDALLCPQLKDGYYSRFYVSEKIYGVSRNWNSVVRILDRNWFAISWQSKPGLTLFQMISLHIDAFNPNAKV